MLQVRLRFLSVKTAVIAPIPSASVITAVAVNPGAFRSCRSGTRRLSLDPNPYSRDSLARKSRRGGLRVEAVSRCGGEGHESRFVSTQKV